MFDAQREAHHAARKAKRLGKIVEGVYAFDRQSADEVLVQRAIDVGWTDRELALARQWLTMVAGVS